MKIENALKKLDKAGFIVSQNGMFFHANKKGSNHEINFISNEGGVQCINVKHCLEKADFLTDYFPGTWCDSITQAIKLAAH